MAEMGRCGHEVRLPVNEKQLATTGYTRTPWYGSRTYDIQPDLARFGGAPTQSLPQGLVGRNGFGDQVMALVGIPSGRLPSALEQCGRLQRGETGAMLPLGGKCRTLV